MAGVRTRQSTAVPLACIPKALTSSSLVDALAGGAAGPGCLGCRDVGVTSAHSAPRAKLGAVTAGRNSPDVESSNGSPACSFRLERHDSCGRGGVIVAQIVGGSSWGETPLPAQPPSQSSRPRHRSQHTAAVRGHPGRSVPVTSARRHHFSTLLAQASSVRHPSWLQSHPTGAAPMAPVAEPPSPKASPSITSLLPTCAPRLARAVAHTLLLATRCCHLRSSFALGRM